MVHNLKDFLKMKNLLYILILMILLYVCTYYTQTEHLEVIKKQFGENAIIAIIPNMSNSYLIKNNDQIWIINTELDSSFSGGDPPEIVSKYLIVFSDESSYILR